MPKAFRLNPEKSPRLLAFFATRFGKLSALLLFLAANCYFDHRPSRILFFAVSYLLLTFATRLRPLVLALAPVVYLFLNLRHEPIDLAFAAFFLTAGILLYQAVMRWPKSLLARRPVAILIGLFTASILGAVALPAGSFSTRLLWSFVGAFASYIWFLAYSLTDRTSQPARDAKLQFSTMHPLWGSTNTPFPKGAAYLRRIEARNPTQFANAQIKGLKLLFWAILLSILQEAWNRLFHHWLQIPYLEEAIALSVAGHPASFCHRWIPLFLSYFEMIFSYAIQGHQIIACARMAGFLALRNTWRPIESRTVAEFFNRFYYYFKELLVDFFYYPAFTRLSFLPAKVRMVLATFAAAGFGNFFYHYTRDWQLIRDQGFALDNFRYSTYLFYCFLLASVLSISQLRRRAPWKPDFFRGQFLPSFNVFIIYSLMEVFDVTQSPCSLMDRFRYFAALFGIRL